MSIKICLDAGHYGRYNRAPGVPEYYESEAMWRLQEKLKAALEGWGMEVVTTREKLAEDRPLFDRGQAAKGCDLFLSLHSNAAGRKTADYVRAYHLAEDSGTQVDDVSQELAKKLAPAVAEAMGVQEGWEALSRLASSDKNGDGMKNDNYYGVLNGARQADVPGVLLEHSFHTNDSMARWLLEDSNLEKLAQAEAAAIAAYFGVEKPIQGPAVTADGNTFTMPVLRKGDKGRAVKPVQAMLDGYGYSCAVDGSFGGKTQKALIAYQGNHELDPDGVCGPDTWAKLLGVAT